MKLNKATTYFPTEDKLSGRTKAWNVKCVKDTPFLMGYDDNTHVTVRLDGQCFPPFSCRWFAIMEIQLFVVLFLYKYEFVLLDAVLKEVKDPCIYIAFRIFISFLHHAQLKNHAQLWLCIMKQNFERSVNKTCNE